MALVLTLGSCSGGARTRSYILGVIRLRHVCVADDACYGPGCFLNGLGEAVPCYDADAQNASYAAEHQGYDASCGESDMVSSGLG